MSLLGRLEDLSLTDIVQIVYLSRRTGMLEIVNSAGRHTVLFRHGLIVNASAPPHLDLASYLASAGLLSPSAARTVRQMEENGISCGSAVLEMNLLSAEKLGQAVRERIQGVVTPLLVSREGEFNFLLSESIKPVEMEYEPEAVFNDGGFAPQKILGAADGEKVKPLRGLEESLKAGKALLRGSGPAASVSPAPPARSEDFDPEPFPDSWPEPVAAAPETESEMPPEPLAEPAATPPPASPGAAAGQFKVAGGLFEVESPDAAFRNVVLFERNPMIRVAVKRAFTREGIKVAQFGSIDDARAAMTELFRSSSFFITFLELTADDSSLRLLQQLKRRNGRLPVVIIDHEADLSRRQELLRAGADLYLTKPSPARLQPGLAEGELTHFADELLLFCERAFTEWEDLTGGGVGAGKTFYEMAEKENTNRSFGLLQQLINELSNPDDIDQVATTILHLAAEYLDRGALFRITSGAFVGLGGFGSTGAEDAMNLRARRIRISRREPSVLFDVATSRGIHRGKMKKTPANVDLLENMGTLLPTEVVVFPIVQGEHAIGILYGDNAEHRAPIDSVTGLEIFLGQCGLAFGNAVFATEKAESGREGL